MPQLVSAQRLGPQFVDLLQTDQVDHYFEYKFQPLKLKQFMQ